MASSRRNTGGNGEGHCAWQGITKRNHGSAASRARCCSGRRIIGGATASPRAVRICRLRASARRSSGDEPWWLVRRTRLRIHVDLDDTCLVHPEVEHRRPDEPAVAAELRRAALWRLCAHETRRLLEYRRRITSSHRAISTRESAGAFRRTATHKRFSRQGRTLNLLVGA